MPLFAFEHIERRLFTPMAYTVGYALLGALLTALLLTPTLSYVAYHLPQNMRRNRWLEKLDPQKILKKQSTLLASTKSITE